MFCLSPYGTTVGAPLVIAHVTDNAVVIVATALIGHILGLDRCDRQIIPTDIAGCESVELCSSSFLETNRNRVASGSVDAIVGAVILSFSPVLGGDVEIQLPATFVLDVVGRLEGQSHHLLSISNA